MGFRETVAETTALVLIGLSGPVMAADVTVGVNVYSWHAKPGYESFTPGAYIRYGGDWFAEAGVYRNSIGKTSPHVGGGYAWQATDRLDLTLAAGVVGGYAKPIKPFLIPSVGVRLTQDVRARVFMIPAAEKNSSACISLAVEYRIP